MKHLKIYSILILILGFCSCNSKTKSNTVEKDIIIKHESTVKDAQSEHSIEAKFSDTININYKDHKALLNILKILPELTMDSWEWSKKDRIKTVNFIKKNNYLVDSTELYHNLKYIKPNTIGIQVVDGFWTLSIYKFNVSNYFIVTNDIVGDGNDINTFNYINNILTPTKMINWFSDFDYKLLTNNTPNCIEALEDNQLSYNYDFTDNNKITISSWLINKVESKSCFKGNTITYKLNKKNKTFDIVNVYWKSDKDNEKQQIEETDTINVTQNTENSSLQSIKKTFIEGLKNGKSLSHFFSNGWTLIYHEDNRCDGSTDGEINNLASTKIDTSIKLQVINDGDGWACDKKKTENYTFNFSLKEQIKNWNRFEIADYENKEESVAYVLGAGESDFLKLHFNDDLLITKLEYRSEDPG